jgi:regulator of sigma D
MSREDLKKNVMNYINNNLNSEYLEDRIDIVLRILYEIEEYLDYKNETIDKVIDLLQNEPIFH